MSKNNNVNPGQYKVAGRLRTDEDDRPDQDKARASIEEHELREEAQRSQKKNDQE